MLEDITAVRWWKRDRHRVLEGHDDIAGNEGPELRYVSLDAERVIVFHGKISDVKELRNEGHKSRTGVVQLSMLGSVGRFGVRRRPSEDSLHARLPLWDDRLQLPDRRPDCLLGIVTDDLFDYVR